MGLNYKSKETAFNGVILYIQRNHCNLIPSVKDYGQLKKHIVNLQREFLDSINVKYIKNKEQEMVQKNWKEFKSFLKSK